MVPVLSSAARIPLPGAAIALAVAISSSAYLLAKALPRGFVREAILIRYICVLKSVSIKINKILMNIWSGLMVGSSGSTFHPPSHFQIGKIRRDPPTDPNNIFFHLELATLYALYTASDCSICTTRSRKGAGKLCAHKQPIYQPVTVNNRSLSRLDFPSSLITPFPLLSI